MEVTLARLLCLQVVAAHGGRMSHDEQELAKFCDDASTLTKPDIFNQCHDAGWLVSKHDNHLDASFVELTHEGLDVLRSAVS